MLKRKVILFANTLWFLNRFKSSLFLDLLKRDYKVIVVYFRKGPLKDLKTADIYKTFTYEKASLVLDGNSGAGGFFIKTNWKLLNSLIKRYILESPKSDVRPVCKEYPGFALKKQIIKLVIRTKTESAGIRRFILRS